MPKKRKGKQKQTDYVGRPKRAKVLGKNVAEEPVLPQVDKSPPLDQEFLQENAPVLSSDVPGEGVTKELALACEESLKEDDETISYEDAIGRFVHKLCPKCEIKLDFTYEDGYWCNECERYWTYDDIQILKPEEWTTDWIEVPSLPMEKPSILDSVRSKILFWRLPK